jgi:hypothetical protein
MAAMKTGTIVKVGGYVKRTYVNPAKSFASVDVDAPDIENPQDHAPIVPVKTFARGGGFVEDFASLKPGQKVMLTCKVSMEKLKDKDGNPIKVRGYDFYYPSFICKKIEIESSSIRQEQKKDEPKENDQPAGNDPGWSKTGKW